MADAKEVILIDLSAIFWSSWHSSSDQPVSAAKERTLQQIARITGDGSKLVAIACDSKRSWRKELLPQYKANRPAKDLQVVGELDRTKERLRADGHVLWEADGFEADDVIATATRLALEAGHVVTIATPDKDLLQLVGDRVRVLRTHINAIWRSPDVEAFAGVPPAMFADWLALVGDKSDNIAGAPGVGPVRAASLLKHFGGLMNALDAYDSPKGQHELSKAIGMNTAAKVGDVIEDIKLGRKIVGLRTDAPIKWDEIYAERRPQRLTTDDEEDIDMPNDEREPGADDGDESVPSPVSATIHPENAQQTSKEPKRETAMITAPVQAVVVPFEFRLEPASMGEARHFAKWAFDSRLYQQFKSPEQILMIITRGRELRLGATTALDVFDMIQGRPAPKSHFVIAKAQEHPDCEYLFCVETTDAKSTWETKNRRNPRPQTLTYTIEQATRAGLVSQGGNWKTRPDDMLRKTCGVKLARMVYPGAALGLYADDEFSDQEAA